MNNLSEAIDVLSDREYYEFVFNKYKPSIYESDELKDNRFCEGTYYSHLCRTRCFLVYREIVKHLSIGSNIIDVGVFPGTLIRQLKTLLGDKIICYGIGQKVDTMFEAFMQPYLKKCVNVELDPFYLESAEKISIPLETDMFDAVVATEILEHLISPLELISEGTRILKKGGLFLLTTPNVSHIGAVLKLMTGRSNYERLHRSPMYLQNDPWRGHIRFYDKHELIQLFNKTGCRLLKHSYYQERGWVAAKEPILKKIITKTADMFFPIYREGHFAVFQKI